MSRRAKLRKALAFSASDWRLLLAASAWLPLVWLTLQARGLEPARRLLRLDAPRSERPAPPRVPPERIAFLVKAAARHHLFSFACLPRALVLQRLLTRRGWESRLRIGVRPGGGSVHAHAWVECGGQPLGEDPGALEDFATLRSGTVAS